MLTFTSNVFSQDPFYYRIDRAKGLPSNTVYDVFQDANGFMWFSGSFGLCRYDGSQFQTFEANHTSSKSGTGIKQDKTGRIWYCNFDGKILYVEGGKVNQLKQNSEFGFFHFAIIQDYLYVVENNEIAVYDVKTRIKKHVISFDTKKIKCTHGSDNHFYIITDKLFVISSSGVIKRVELPVNLKSNINGIMMQSVGDELLLLSKYNVDTYKYRNGVFILEKIISNGFIQNVSAGNNKFWLSTTNGFIPLRKGLNSTYLAGNNVSDVLEDKSGHLWVSTLDKGVRFIPDLKIKFIYSDYSPTVLQTFKDNKLLIGTDRENLYSTNFESVSFKTVYAGQTNHAFNNLFVDSAANRIFGTSNTFKLFDINGKLKKEMSLALKDMVKIESDIYAYSATWQCGLLKLSDVKSDWDSIFTSFNELTEGELRFKPIITNIRGKSVAYKPQWNAIYFSSNKGLFKVTKQKITEIMHKEETINAVKLVAYNDCLLALSVDNQIYRLDRLDSIAEIDIKKVLSGQSPTFMKMLHNDLYVFTRNSVFQYDVEQNKAHKILSINDDFEWHDIAQLQNKLVISTNKGYIITASTNKIQYSTPVLVIDSIRNGNKSQHVSDFSLVKAENANVSIYFSHVCFNPDNQSFVHYSLNGGEWNKIVDNRNVIDFENLKSGKYRIEIKYGNGFVNSYVTVLSFEVDKPFWLKWWFILLAISLLGFMIYSFDKWRTARINQKSQEIIDRIQLEKTANQSKLKALKSQMNPHFFFNALNTIQSFILENDKKMAISVLSKFSNLTRSILEMSDKDEVSVAEEIKVLQLYLDIEKVRFNDDFEYEIVTNDFDTDSYKIPSLLLQPYVENAIKHGLLHKNGYKRLLVSFNMEPTMMRILIDDNGIGRKKSMELNAIKYKKHNSFSTQAIEKRVKLLNEFAGKKITVEYIDETIDADKVHGTTVVIKIPLEII